MDRPYSAWADWLSKFHTWPEWIQALWLIAVPLTLLGVTWLVMRGVSEALGPLRERRMRGRWMIYRHGREPVEADWTNPLPELIGPGMRGVLRRPEE